MIRVNDVLEFLCLKFPLEEACDFDNVGLLVGDKNEEVKKVLVCLDADISAIKKAEEIGANLIVTHHPIIFSGIKNVTSDMVVYKAARKGISIISMHTNFDVGDGGVNDILSSLLPVKNIKKFKSKDGYLLNLAQSEISDPDDFANRLKEILGFSIRYVSGKPIKNILICSGSGGDFIEDVIDNNFDALVTADVKHNRFIDAKNAGISLFDAGHYATENICVKPLCKLLESKFSKTEFHSFEPNFIKSI